MKPYRSARRCSRHESFLFRMNVYVVRTWKNTPLCVYVKWKFTLSKMTMELVWVWIHYKCTKQNKCNNRLKSEAKIFDFLSHSIFGDFWLRMGNQTSTHGEYVGLAHANFFDQHTLYFFIHPHSMVQLYCDCYTLPDLESLLIFNVYFDFVCDYIIVCKQKDKRTLPMCEREFSKGTKQIKYNNRLESATNILSLTQIAVSIVMVCGFSFCRRFWAIIIFILLCAFVLNSHSHNGEVLWPFRNVREFSFHIHTPYIVHFDSVCSERKLFVTNRARKPTY